MVMPTIMNGQGPIPYRNEQARANSKTQHVHDHQMFYYSQTIKKVNSYKERKNNSYNTEKLL